MPRDQTVEGGAQIRVTPTGFQKLSAVLPALLNQSLAGGFCVPRGEVGKCTGGFPNTGACYCVQNSGPGCNPGCKANVAINPGGFSMTVTNQNRLRINLATSLNTQIVISGRALGISLGSCTLNITSPNLNGSFDIALGVKAVDGELDLRLAQINAFQLNLDINGCGFLGDLGNLVADLIDELTNSFLGEFILDALTPAVNGIIQNLLPNPLGIAGMMDIGDLLGGVSPGTDGYMEARVVPGGYADLVNNGMSLGVITGLNADEDPSTRGLGLTSEPHLCVPPLGAPQFGAAPASLPLSTRNTFRLDRAGAFTGGAGNEPNADIAMGISETTLDLAGHHLVTSGGMCLGVGTTLIEQLNVSTIGLLVPSVADLASDEGNDPLLLVTRPQRALDFKIGDNTPTSPALTIGISHLEVDFYAFLYERYVRAFTMDLTMNVGINLEFEQMPGQPAKIKPTIVGISSSEVQIKVINKEFVKETTQRLEMVLPSVFDLVTPLLGNLPPIEVPTFAGFSLNNLSIKKVTTSQDEFLALYASLGPSSFMLKKIDPNEHFGAAVFQQLEADKAVTTYNATRGSSLISVETPDPAIVRKALEHQPNGALPQVTFEVDRFDPNGRELEWAYNLNGGLFHQWQPGGTFVIRDRAFAWQGKYTVGLKSRVKGDYTTTSPVTETAVVIDSVGPNILVKKAEWNGSTYEVPLWDIVSGKVTQYAFAQPGGADPTVWHEGGTAQIDRDALQKLAENGEVLLYAKDETGNTTVALVAPFHGQPGEAGCNCETGDASGSLLLVVIVGFVLVGRRRLSPMRLAILRILRRHQRVVSTLALWAGMSAVMSLAPGCSCSNAEKSCETAADCGPDFCAPGELPICLEGTCECIDDIIIGKVGPYSDVAVHGDGTIWVSAYAQTYGDLVVTRAIPGRIPDESWEWVDGVPDGPVVFEGSKLRNGIEAKGEDVGMYTSIAVAPDGSPMVAYFDRDTASLKFAKKTGDVWQKHTIEQGSGELAEFSGELVGMYTSLTIRGDNGHPGIAYLAHVADQAGVRAEVRFAAAQTANPTSAADWQTWVVDKAPLPPDDPMKPDVYPLPGGLGLFVDSARLPNHTPVVVYYDRAKGDLKLAKLNTTTNMFEAKILDGSGDLDAGWSPSVAVAPDGKVHVAYVAASGDDLRYIVEGSASTIVDDGYRVVGVTVDNLPKPEFHFVGEDAGLVLANNGQTPMIAYQDATTQELLLTEKRSDNTWARNSVAGHTDPWPGAYGFFTATALLPTEIVISTWVINQPMDENWVEVFKRPTALQ